MKSTYNLLSIHLDHQPIPKSKPQLIRVSDIPVCSEIDEEYSLMDIPYFIRKVSGLKLLSTVSLNESATLIKKNVDCQELIIILDYQCFSEIACTLYMKRILQTISYLQSCYPGMTVFLAGDNPKWNLLLNQVFETQTC